LKPLRVAVVGAGWAGIAAAAHARRLGHAVSVFEMAPHLGGRARSVPVLGVCLDNGQHILIGAYRATLELMHILGADASSLLLRIPLAMKFPDGHGLSLPPGAPVPGFVRAVLGCRNWSWFDRLALLGTAGLWAARGFRCASQTSVAQLCARLPSRVRAQLIDPLCVAALNTPAPQASAAVFLRGLHDALFSGAGSADLLLPRGSLDTLVPQPAARWFEQRGVRLHLGTRVAAIRPEGPHWRVDGVEFDKVVLACTATEAARLCEPMAPAWAAQARALRYEPIVTVYLRCDGARLAAPMTVLVSSVEAPAQFAFDLGSMGGPAGVFAFVVSGARQWVERGLPATAQAAIDQARAAFAPGTWVAPLSMLHIAAEKRATFQCTPDLSRPGAQVAPGLTAAGDYVEGPYPATLEGAVLSGRAAALALQPAQGAVTPA
jgi:squalene-associated FAD-dependent desaturase